MEKQNENGKKIIKNKVPLFYNNKFNYFSPTGISSSSEYLDSKKGTDIYLGMNKNKYKVKKKNKKVRKGYFTNNNYNVLSYNIGRAYVLNYPASSNVKM